MIRILSTIMVLVVCLGHSAFADDTDKVKSQVRQANAAFKDMKATVVVVESNRTELGKIGKSFSFNYEFKKASICFKSPDKLKMNGTLGMVKVEFITTGNTRIIRAPSIRVKKREDITEEQEKRMTSLDVGVVTESIWSVYQVTPVRVEKSESGSNVFVLRLKTAKSRKSQMIWVEEKTCKLLRRDKLFDDGSLKAKTVYSAHTLIKGIWIAGKAEVYNVDGKLAAVAETKDVVINSSVNDKEFE